MLTVRVQAAVFQTSKFLLVSLCRDTQMDSAVLQPQPPLLRREKIKQCAFSQPYVQKGETDTQAIVIILTWQLLVWLNEAYRDYDNSKQQPFGP